MRAKSLLTFLTIAVLLSMVLTACGKPSPTAVAPAATEETQPAATEEPEPAATEETQPAATEEPEPAATEEAEPVASEPHSLWSTELKQAFAAAIDREVIVDRVFEGRNTPAYHMVPAGYPYATEPFLDKYGTRDLDMAISLLEGLGYTPDKPFEFDLWYPPEHYGTTTADVMQVIKEQLEETGLIKVTLQSQNWAEYVDSFVAGEAFPIFVLGWFPDFADPDTWLTPFASCISSPDNGVNYCDEKMDDLLQRAAASSDPAEREELYKELGVYYAEQVPTLPLFWEPEFIIMRDGIEGVAIGAPFEFNYNVVSFGPDAQPASGSTDTIIIGTTDEVNSLDPQDAYATHDWEVLKNTNVPLLKYIPGTSELVPAAAELPTASEDGKTYTFKLRSGIKFADGTPVTAQDYVRSWDRLNTLEGQVSGLMQAYIEDVEAPDDTTVVIKLKDSYGFLDALAATAPFIPSNPNIFAEDTILQYPEKLDGIGPYRMVSHVPGQQMVLEANPEYFDDDKPIIPTVIIRYFADPTTMSNAVEKGEIDIAWRTVGPVEAVRLQSVSGLVVATVEAPSLRYLVFNHNYMVGGE